MSFLYKGETSVQKLHLDSFLALARELGVRGFSEVIESPSENLLAIRQDAEDNLGENLLGEGTSENENNYEGGSHEISNNERFFSKDQEADTNVTDDTGIKPKPGRPPPNTGHIWKFVEKVDMNFMCNMCGNSFPYFHGIQEHLLKLHSDNIDVVKLIGNNLQSDDTGHTKAYSHIQDEEENGTIKNKSESENVVWNYYKKSLGEECICNLCEKVLLTHDFFCFAVPSFRSSLRQPERNL